jgi:hypothetical protein
MNLKRQSISGKLYNVIDHEEFVKNRELYEDPNTAVEIDINDKKYILPLRNKATDNRPGLYNEGCLDFFVLPDENQYKEYSTLNTIDFGNCNSMVEVMEKQKMLRDEEKEILTNPDNIFIPPISGKESPAMAGLKQAVIAKRIDIDKYQDRFGKENFPNDKRKFKDNDITMFMLNRMNKALDIKATIILEDKHPNVPNPIGKKIIMDLTGYDKDDNE